MNLTNQLKLACKLMEITLLDHLIITIDSYFSFEDEGLL
ncbi:MAG TPA: JAB domain-containing protein [Puia sp.]